MKKLLILALAAGLSACASTSPVLSPGSVAAASVAVDRAQARYDQAKAFTELFLPYLPADHAARIRLAGRIAEEALLAARTATTIAEQRAALDRAEAATTEIDAAAGP